MKNKLAPNIVQLDCGAQVVWCTPTGGYGHVADEQPMPYIHYNGQPLTPRFGGEESVRKCSNMSLPLPYGKLAKWPISQEIFNLLRRRVNIYWRNIVKSFNSKKPYFLFAEQLKFKRTESGFSGESPIISFERQFRYNKTGVDVYDRIEFKCYLEFSEFYYAMCPEIVTQLISSQIELLPSESSNYKFNISASTGEAVVKCKLLKSIKFKAGDILKVHYNYRIKGE